MWLIYETGEHAVKGSSHFYVQACFILIFMKIVVKLILIGSPGQLMTKSWKNPRASERNERGSNEGVQDLTARAWTSLYKHKISDPKAEKPSTPLSTKEGDFSFLYNIVESLMLHTEASIFSFSDLAGIELDIISESITVRSRSGWTGETLSLRTQDLGCSSAIEHWLPSLDTGSNPQHWEEMQLCSGRKSVSACVFFLMILYFIFTDYMTLNVGRF